MKTLLITVLLTATLSAQSQCSYAIENANKQVEGLRISFDDKDKWGIRASRDSFKYWTKIAIMQCPKAKSDEMREWRKEVLQKIEAAGI